MQIKRTISFDSPKNSTTGWLTTFNDLITLLMVFFVLVFSTSSIDTNNLKEFSAALQSGFGVLQQGNRVPIRVVDAGKPVHYETDWRRQVADAHQPQSPNIPAGVDPAFEALDELAGIQVSYRDQGILVTLEGHILFDLGKADLHPQSYPLLRKVADAIRPGEGPVRIEGHTDNVPIQTRRYPSNWELSTARAVNVLRHFVEREALAPGRFSAVGYADARPRFSMGGKMSRKLLIVVLAVLVLIVGSVGAGFFLMWTKINSIHAQAAAPEGSEQEETEPMPKIGPIHSLNTFIVNLADEGGVRYLRTTMKLDLEDEQSLTVVEERLPMIRDSILVTLSTKRYDDISTVEGKKSLREELIAQLNGIMVPGSVRNIYFTEFVVQ